MYVDDIINMNKSENEIDKAFRDIQRAGFDLRCEGVLADYLRIEIQRKRDDTIHMQQPTMIRKILNNLGFNDSTKLKPNPAKIATTLNGATQEPPHNAKWD